MAPNPHNLTLSKDAFAPSGDKNQNSSGGDYPSQVKLVVCGSAGAKAVDSLAETWKQNGFGRGKTELTGIIYELGHGEKADPAMEQFSVAHEAPGHIPLTLVHPLVGGVAGKLTPPDTSPQHAHYAFSLPTINKAEELQGENEGKWLELLKEASQRSIALEMCLGGDDSVREALEKLLGKAWDEEAERAKSEGKDVNTTGVRIVFDMLASPPLTHSSSQLSRSPEMENWSDFVRRLALHPRVYLKLSPLPISSLLPPGLLAPTRTADARGSTVSSTLANALQAAGDAASQATSTTESLVSAQDRRGELLRRLRIFLDTALEAFGEERLVWAANMGVGSAAITQASNTVNKEALSQPEEWFEVCRESLAQSGLSQAGLDNIFASNASKVYRL